MIREQQNENKSLYISKSCNYSTDQNIALYQHKFQLPKCPILHQIHITYVVAQILPQRIEYIGFNWNGATDTMLFNVSIM